MQRENAKTKAGPFLFDLHRLVEAHPIALLSTAAVQEAAVPNVRNNLMSDEMERGGGRAAFQGRNIVIAPSPVVINHSGKAELPLLKRSEDKATNEKETMLETRSPTTVARLDSKDLNALEAATNTGFPPWMHLNEPSRRSEDMSTKTRQDDKKVEEKEAENDKKYVEKKDLDSKSDDMQALEKRGDNERRTGKVSTIDESIAGGTGYYTPAHGAGAKGNKSQKAKIAGARSTSQRSDGINRQPRLRFTPPEGAPPNVVRNTRTGEIKVVKEGASPQDLARVNRNSSPSMSKYEILSPYGEDWVSYSPYTQPHQVISQGESSRNKYSPPRNQNNDYSMGPFAYKNNASKGYRQIFAPLHEQEGYGVLMNDPPRAPLPVEHPPYSSLPALHEQ